jgi:catechol 2,3-dioxygenase-like lactoylglutathione lyase family enzyme
MCGCAATAAATSLTHKPRGRGLVLVARRRRSWHSVGAAVGRIGANAEGAKPTYETVNRNAPMPNLENLKKQAKLIQRWHRERYYPVAAQIRTILPRFRHLSDGEILAQSFKLSDAQEMVARQAGFESWQALRSGIDTMPQQTKPARAKAGISMTAAQLFVADVKASCAFFTEKLGFSIVFIYGEPPFYAQVRRDNGLLNLRCMDRPVIDPALRERESLLSADMGVNTHEEIKQLFLEFQARGATFFQTLKKTPWGAKNFIVKDPDGNLLLFAGPGE